MNCIVTKEFSIFFPTSETSLVNNLGCFVCFPNVFMIHFTWFYEGGPQPSVLQEVSIPVWSNQECKLKYGGAAPGGIVEHMLCAGKASMDSCSVSS